MVQQIVGIFTKQFPDCDYLKTPDFRRVFEEAAIKLYADTQLYAYHVSVVRLVDEKNVWQMVADIVLCYVREKVESRKDMPCRTVNDMNTSINEALVDMLLAIRKAENLIGQEVTVSNRGQSKIILSHINAQYTFLALDLFRNHKQYIIRSFQ